MLAEDGTAFRATDKTLPSSSAFLGRPLLNEKVVVESSDLLLDSSTDTNNGSRQNSRHRFSASYIQRLRKQLAVDGGSICFLISQYILMGVLIGLNLAMPLILETNGATYSQQAVFSFTPWPFSLNLLWAPVVDAVSWQRVGRRKTWIVSCQYLTGLFLITVAYFASGILDTADVKNPPNVYILTAVFLAVNFLAATESIAVDGWGQNILSRKNVGHLSSCTMIGVSFGAFIGRNVFLVLQSKEFANKWFRAVPSESGLLGFDMFIFFLGLIFVFSATLILVFKHEANSTTGECVSDGKTNKNELKLGIIETYRMLFRILCLKPVLILAAFLLTKDLASTVSETMTQLRLVAAGVSADKIATGTMFVFLIPVIISWLFHKQTEGPTPLNINFWAYPLQLFMGLVFLVLVYFTSSFREPNGEFSYLYYTVMFGSIYFERAIIQCMYLMSTAFFAQISDEEISGTYLTLLSTLVNLGDLWPSPLIFYVTDLINRKNCVSTATKIVLATCNTKADEQLCKGGGNVCEVVVDGYYISGVLSAIIGLIWFGVFYSRIHYFHKVPKEEWKVVKR